MIWHGTGIENINGRDGMHNEVIGQEAHEEGDPNYMVHPHQQTMLLFFNLAKLNVYDHLLSSLLSDKNI